MSFRISQSSHTRLRGSPAQFQAAIMAADSKPILRTLTGQAKIILDETLEKLGAEKTGRNYTYYVLPKDDFGPEPLTQEDWTLPNGEITGGITVIALDKNNEPVLDSSGRPTFKSFVRQDYIDRMAPRHQVSAEEYESNIAVHELVHNNRVLRVPIPKSDKEIEKLAARREEFEQQDEYYAFLAGAKASPQSALVHAIDMADRVILEKQDYIEGGSMQFEVAAIQEALKTIFTKYKIKATPKEFLQQIKEIYLKRKDGETYVHAIEKALNSVSQNIVQKTKQKVDDVYKDIYNTLRQFNIDELTKLIPLKAWII